MPRAIVLVLAAVFACTGCGASDEERVETVVRDYARASAAGDAETACALTAAEMWTDVRCEDIVALNSDPGSQEAGRRLAGGEYEVTIDGDRATAHGHNLGSFTLRRVDGDWKLIDSR
jgi:hypothetical protein